MNSLRNNFSWVFLGNAVYAACQWGMLVALAKLGSAQIVGQFALAFAIITPVIMISNMQLRGVQATDAKNEYHLADYMAVRLLSSFIAVLLVLVILYLSHFSKAVFLATFILLIAKFAESFSDIFYGFFQQHEKMSFMAKSMIIKGILSLVVLGALFYFLRSLPWSLFGILCTWTIVLVLYDWKMAKYLLKEIQGEETSRNSLIVTSIHSFVGRRKILIHIIYLSFPLGLVMGITSLNTNIPNYAIIKYLGSKDLGIFAALNYTTVAINMFVQALGQAMTPRMARDFASRNFVSFYRLLKKMILINFLIGSLGVLIVFIGGGEILAFIYTREYAMHSNLFIVLMISATFSSIASAFGHAMTATRQFSLQVPLFLVVLVATYLIAFFSIPYFKLYGATLAFIVSALIQIVGGILIIRLAVRKQ